MLPFASLLVALLLTGSQLNAQIAAGHEKFLGNIMPSSWSSQVVPDDYGDYWNQVSPENAGKWGSIESSRDTYDWSDLDLIYEYSRDNNIPFRQHVMVWGNQQPDWMQNLSVQDQREEVEEWYNHIATRYPGTEIIEVINEQLPGHSDDIHYIDAIGGTNDGANNPYLAEHSDEYGPYNTGWDYVIWAFAKAREYFPDATLHINDYNVINNQNNIDQYLDIIEILNDRGLIDAVGLQSHYFSVDQMDAQTVTSRLDYIHDQTGLPIYITELDITGSPNEQSSEDDPQVQRQRFEELFPAFWNHPAVIGVTLWGYMEGVNWVEDRGHGTSALLNEDGSERPAMVWLKEFIADQVGDELNITRQPQDQQVQEGEEVTFEVNVNGAEPITYQWYLDGQLIDGATESTYTIPSVDESHTGDYHVIINNDFTEDLSSDTATLSLVVKEPYNGTPHAIPGTIEVEEFDLGGQDLSYNETTPNENQGGAFRTDEGVDIGESDDGDPAQGGYIIAYIENGEWLEYTVNVEEAGQYDITYRVASGGDGEFTLSIDGTEIDQVQTPSTTNDPEEWWQDYTYTDVVHEGIQLDAGEQVLRVDMISGGFNFNYITFEPTPVTSTSASADLNIHSFPNPSASAFNVEYPGQFQYTVSDMTGEPLETGSASDYTTFGSDLPAGVYLLQLRGESGMKTIRLIKQ